MSGFFRRFLQLFQPGASRGGGDRTVLLATAPSEPVARMWQDILRRENITAMVQARGGGVAYGSMVASEFSLHVLESQLEHAQEVLEPYLEER